MWLDLSKKQCKSQFQYFSLAVIVNNAGAALMRALFPEIFISKLYNPISNLYYSISQCCGWWMVEMFMDLRMLLCVRSRTTYEAVCMDTSVRLGQVYRMDSFHVTTPNTRDPRDQVMPCLHPAPQSATFRPSVSGHTYFIYIAGFMFSDSFKK